MKNETKKFRFFKFFCFFNTKFGPLYEIGLKKFYAIFEFCVNLKNSFGKFLYRICFLIRENNHE